MKNRDTLPKDLISVREAAAAAGVSVRAVRNWIFTGKNGRKLPTYRQPNLPDRVLVSRATVMIFQASRAGRRRPGGSGPIAVSLDKNLADEVRELVRMMSARIGVRLSMAEALRSAAAYALRLEKARAERGEGERDA